MKKSLGFTFVFLLISWKLMAQPIQLHPENNHYFLYKEKPTVLVASTEHYGSVVNPDFNFEKYLNTIVGIGLNHTRIWMGDYIEIPGDFCQSVNTSAPQPGMFLTPWARSSESGYAAGGNKFDLDKWNPEYFKRLHAFMQKASDYGIVVECIFFFVGPNWKLLPMNSTNNVNNTASIVREDYMSLNNGNILDYQKKYCLKLISELNKYDNVIFNIANEPWFANQEHVGFSSPPRDGTKEWIREVSEWIVNEEVKLPKKHLISVDYSNEGKVITKQEQEKYWKNISIFNHHYDKDALSAKLNYGINKALSFNETGLMPEFTSQYRIQGWKYLMSGGAIYDNLDFTFQIGSEDGTGRVEFLCEFYKGCNDPKVKYEMKVLLDFVNTIDFVHSKPNYNVVVCAFGDKNICVLENPGKEYTLYVYGGSNEGLFQVSLIPGKYDVTYINPSSGKVIKRDEVETIKYDDLNLKLPEYNEDIAIVLKVKQPTYSVFPVCTERVFTNYLLPKDGWNPFINHVKPFSELTPSFHMYGGTMNTGENETGKIIMNFKGNKEVSVPEGKTCLHVISKQKGSLAGLTYKHLGLKNPGNHGNTPYEEYIFNFSDYKYNGKFYFRYWLKEGAKYKIMAKVDSLIVTGTGQWEDAIIYLEKEVHTHHNLIWLENKNEVPVHIYIDDAFYYKGELPADLIREKNLRANELK